MRADAARRREAIITQARHIFAERGGDVALEAIAAASGVGIATLYRNFPSREDLIAAVVDDMVQQILDAVEEAKTEAVEDAAAAWETLLTRLLDLELGALTDGLGVQARPASNVARGGGSDAASPLARIQQPALDALDELVAVLQDAKAVRGGLRGLDVIVALATITRPQAAPIREAAPEVRAQLAEAYLAWTRTG
ncbi:Nucleoid occlusion factor SlmA [Arthrobacter saudimassiliensis]|uniref:Nucleoid occlusion factor SlmA n=1 Tax=Arthrobacter saudimassiliensis TaxID=1461584 RepID=A0A078MR90_9MICC|nr:Nucleoid occlusion factor SlmA [Arthrobacter saudimassiliensis]